MNFIKKLDLSRANANIFQYSKEKFHNVHFLYFNVLFTNYRLIIDA